MNAGKFYRIGQVAKILNVNPSVIRYWETEFIQIQAERSEKGQRVYSEEKVRLLQHIKKLLYEKKLTIEGARQELAFSQDITREEYEFNDFLLSELYELKKILEISAIL